MTRKLKLFWLSMMLAVPGPAFAAGLKVKVTDQAGAPAANAVVTIKPLGAADLSGWQKPKEEMRQQNTQFVPFVMAATVGDTVSFPNFDEFRHHVYSFSKPKRFELRLYGQDETKTVTFDKAGVVALGCNIHDNMLAYIYVTPDPVYGVADKDGIVHLDGLPAGDYHLQFWHPDLASNITDGPTVTIPADGTAESAVSLTLKANRRVQQPPAEESYQ